MKMKIIHSFWNRSIISEDQGVVSIFLFLYIFICNLYIYLFCLISSSTHLSPTHLSPTYLPPLSLPHLHFLLLLLHFLLLLLLLPTQISILYPKAILKPQTHTYIRAHTHTQFIEFDSTDEAKSQFIDQPINPPTKWITNQLQLMCLLEYNVIQNPSMYSRAFLYWSTRLSIHLPIHSPIHPSTSYLYKNQTNIPL